MRGLRRFALPLVILASSVLLGCGSGRGSAAAPHIVSLSSAGKPQGNRPFDLHGTVVDSSGQPIANAHVSYNKQVVKTDAAGAFTFQSVPPDQTLYVVAAGYQRYVGPWSQQSQIKLAPFQARGIYMPYSGLSNPAVMETIDKYTNNTEINAVILEIKTDDGQVPPEMATAAAEQNHAVQQNGDIKGFIAKMHERGIDVIGRFVVFRDPTLANAHPEWALKRVSDGQPYADEQGQKWIDAFRQEVQQYDLDIAEKAAQMGIDEIQFDYVRFPGAISRLQYAEPNTEENRVAAIAGFLRQAEQRLRPYGIALGADTFGMTTIATDDTGIGQDITTLGQYIDYYCPMVYPSTWAPGSFGVAYPAADPYAIVFSSTQSAVKRLAGIPTVKVRSWLQSFDDYQRERLSYTPDRVNTQKTAALKGGAVGWMLWHPMSHFDAPTIGPRSADWVPAEVTKPGG